MPAAQAFKKSPDDAPFGLAGREGRIDRFDFVAVAEGQIGRRERAERNGPSHQSEDDSNDSKADSAVHDPVSGGVSATHVHIWLI